MTDNLPEITTFEGHPVINLTPGAQYPFSFGVTKAKLFIEEYHKIRLHYKEYYALYLKCGRDKSILKATLTLGIGSDYPVMLSMAKCKKIIDNLEAIKSFVNKSQ